MPGSRDTLRGGVEYDLHNHTDRSKDARISGQRLLEFARRRGLKGIGICEHDVFPETGLFEPARELGLDLALGIEFSCGDVHLIGYGLALSASNEAFLQQRFERVADNACLVANRLVDGLRDCGLCITSEEVKRYAGKPLHTGFVLKYLVEELRCFPDLARARTFLQQRGLEWADDHGLEFLPPEQVIDLIHESGGTAVWAHPFFTPEAQRRQRLEALVKAGLDGVEVVYAYRENGYPGPESNAVLEARMLALLHDQPVFISSGSDSHYPVRTDELQRPVHPGDAGITSQDVERFRQVFQQHVDPGKGQTKTGKKPEDPTA